MNQKYERQMKKGVLDILVLKLLENEKRYGYELIKELEEKSSKMFTLKEGTLYPILYRLEEDELLISKWSEPKDKEIPRKYYFITEKGKQELNDLSQLWIEFKNNVTLILEG